MSKSREKYDGMRAAWDIVVNTCIANCAQIPMKEVVFGYIVDVVDQQDAEIETLKLTLASRKQTCDGYNESMLRQHREITKLREALEAIQGQADTVSGSDEFLLDVVFRVFDEIEKIANEALEATK
jgi:hypothetical protein